MNFKLHSKTIQKIASFIESNRIVNAVLKGVAIYIAITLVFGLLYFLFDSLDFKSTVEGKTIRIFDYFYFSAVTFTTIGYGDFVPKDIAGQIIVFIESCFELTFIPVFGGYLAYKFLQRPNDILLTDNFFIRFRDQRIFLSSRVGNKGRNLIDCTATIELIQITNNVKRTLYKREINTPLVEFIWFLEIRLDAEENNFALQQLKTLMTNPDTALIRTTVIGFDSNSGNLVHVFKYYTMDKLIFGGKFLDVYTWEGVKRTQPDWTNFNKVESLTLTDQQSIDLLLQKN
ncbi:MAG: potassium channel family protein [Bacteroidales bacterium]